MDNLWRAADDACSATAPALKARMVDMTARFAVALSQDNVPGALQLQSDGDVIEAVTSRTRGGVAQVGARLRALTRIGMGCAGLGGR